MFTMSLRGILTASLLAAGLVACGSPDPASFAQGTWTCSNDGDTYTVEVGDGTFSRILAGRDSGLEGTWAITDDGTLTLTEIRDEGQSGRDWSGAPVPDELADGGTGIMDWDNKSLTVTRDGATVTLTNPSESAVCVK